MAITLFVKANNRPVDYAVSLQMYEAFLASYREANPDDTLIELDLYKERLPYLDADMIGGTFKSGRGLPLTPGERTAVETADRYLEQFLAADKVVFGFPLWNLTVPAVLHTYIDYLNRAGKTFKYTPQGSVGLVPGKKAALLNARGGDYSEGQAAVTEMAVNFVARNLKLFGITEITKVITEGHQMFPDRRNDIIRDGIERSIRAAKSF